MEGELWQVTQTASCALWGWLLGTAPGVALRHPGRGLSPSWGLAQRPRPLLISPGGLFSFLMHVSE